MAPGTLAREQRLQKLLSSAGYCGGEAPRTPWDESPSESILAKPEVEAVETSHGRSKSSPGRQPRQFSARPPRPENGRKGVTSVVATVEASPSLPPVYLGCEESVTEVMSGPGLDAEGESSDDDLPEAPMEGRTQELLAKLSQEELPAVGIVGHSEEDSGSEEDIPKAPLEGQSQEMQEDTNLEVSITGGLMSSSSSSSLGSLTKTLGTTMPTAPEESEAEDAQQPLEVQEIEEALTKNPVRRSCSSSSCSSGPPEAPPEDPGECLVEEEASTFAERPAERPAEPAPAQAPEATAEKARLPNAKVTVLSQICYIPGLKCPAWPLHTVHPHATMALDFALCPTTSSVDWTFLRGEISAWSSQRGNQPVRWMVLCVFSNWIARIPKVWDGCLVGASLALLHAAFCAEPGKERAELFQQVIHGVSLQGWPGLVLEVGWPIFELVAAHGSIVQSGGWHGQEELFPVEPPACTKLTRGADDVRWEASLITMDRAQRLVETGQLRLEEPEVVFSLNLLCSSQTAPEFASATACTLKALAAPQDARRNLIAAAERAVIGCLGEGAPGALITALLRSPWPLAHLLGRLRPPSNEAHTSEKYLLQTEVSGLFWQPLQLPYASRVLTFEQTKDAAFPWVQFVARAVPAERLLMELPWPGGVSFEEIQREAIGLLSQFPTTNYPGPSNDRETWKTLCLVCKDGLQDPATTSEGTVYAKTEILSLAPALERFVDLFGKTGDQKRGHIGDDASWCCRDPPCYALRGAGETGPETGPPPCPVAGDGGDGGNGGTAVVSRGCQDEIPASSRTKVLRVAGGWGRQRGGPHLPSAADVEGERMAGRFQNQRLQSFVEEEPLVFFQPVALNASEDSTDEAIIAELKSMAKMSFTFGAFTAFGGKPVTVILPIGRPGPTELYQSNPAVQVSVLQPAKELGRFERVKATIRADGSGQVETDSLLRPEAPYAQLNGDVYWNHALVKFWIANSLGDLPVYPPWALLDAVAGALEEPRQWTSYKQQQQIAFILPCADVDTWTPRMKDFYISRKAYNITKGCGPFVVPDSGESLAEKVLRRLGYVDEAAPEFTEFALAFFAQSKNKSKLRKADLLPIAGDTVSDVKGKLREAFLSHKVSDGEWLIPLAGDAVLKMLRKQGFLSTGSDELEAMKAYAAAKRLPSRKTRIGRRAERLGKTRLEGFDSRVRLSVVLPGGMIAWHPDARVVENGRLILHVPIRSHPGALTRLGQILFHAPEGVLHWADYSLPHSVFNAGAEPRVHLIVDVASRNNEDFERNFLRRMSAEVLQHFVANAMPPVDAMATEASAVGPPGSSFARPLSRQMSDAYATLLGGSTEMLALERQVWQQVGEAYAVQVAQMTR
eukprot:s342_g21.t1